MLVLERREVHMATAMVVKYFTDGNVSVTAEKDGKEVPELVKTMNIDDPNIVATMKASNPNVPIDVFIQEVKRRHASQGGKSALPQGITEYEDWTFRVGSNTCVVKLINGQLKEVCD
jgi:hypothetical protein